MFNEEDILGLEHPDQKPKAPKSKSDHIYGDFNIGYTDEDNEDILTEFDQAIGLQKHRPRSKLAVKLPQKKVHKSYDSFGLEWNKSEQEETTKRALNPNGDNFQMEEGLFGSIWNEKKPESPCFEETTQKTETNAENGSGRADLRAVSILKKKKKEDQVHDGDCTFEGKRKNVSFNPRPTVIPIEKIGRLSVSFGKSSQKFTPGLRFPGPNWDQSVFLAAEEETGFEEKSKMELEEEAINYRPSFGQKVLISESKRVREDENGSVIGSGSFLESTAVAAGFKKSKHSIEGNANRQVSVKWSQKKTNEPPKSNGRVQVTPPPPTQKSKETSLEEEIRKRIKEYSFSPRSMGKMGLPVSFGQANSKAEIGIESKTQEEPLKEGEKRAMSQMEKNKKDYQYSKDYGIGLKIMKIGGYKVGEGIGAGGQGRLDPVEAKKQTQLKSQKDFMDFIVEQEQDKRNKKENSQRENKEKNEDEKTLEKLIQWKKNYQSKINTSHLGPEPLRTRVERKKVDAENTKIVDMASGENKEYESYADFIASKTQKKAKKGFGVLLREKLQRIKREIIMSDEQEVGKEQEEDTLLLRENELKTEIHKKAKKFSQMNYFLEHLKGCVEQKKGEKPEFFMVIVSFENIWDHSPALFLKSKLLEQFVKMACDFFKHKLSAREFKLGKELAENKDLNGLPEAKCTKEFLLRVHSYVGGTQEEPERYLDIIFDDLLTARISVQCSRINFAVEGDSLYHLMQKWRSVISSKLYEKLIREYISPSLGRQINLPDPQMKPFYDWVYPWVSETSDEGLWLLVLQRIRTAARESKTAADLIRLWWYISPWTHEMRRKENEKFEDLVHRVIMIKLITEMDKLSVDPHKLNAEPLQALLLWAELLPSDVLVETLDDMFFSRLQEVVGFWVEKESVENRKKIGLWIAGWKRYFPEEVLKNNEIQRGFSKILESLSA